MSCDNIIERLEAHIAGRLGDAERRTVDAHLQRCADCSELRAILADTVAEPPADLVSAVLERTSGSTCDSARAQLCEHVDGDLGDIDAALVRSHLDGCGDCESLSRALKRLSTELPQLAELPLDDRFVGDVLERTTLRRPRPVRWADRIADAWQNLVQRPRLAWEGAFVATAVLLVIFGTPNSPLAGVPARVIELTRINPVQELKEPAALLTAELEQTWETLGVETGRWVTDRSRESVGSVAEFSESTLGKLKELGTLWPDDAFESGREDRNDQHEEADPQSSENE